MVSEKTVDSILEKNGNPLVTITLPTHKKGEEIKQDPIRFKNLIGETIEELKNRGMKQAEAEEFMSEASELLNQPRFWTHQDYGLVVYVAKNYFEYFKVPYPIEEKAYLNSHFLITPLLPMVSMDGTYSVLAVSRKNPRLLHCTRNEVTDITPADTPKGVTEYLEETPEKELQFHTGAEGMDAMFFGHGGGEEDKKVVVEQYFRELEKEITKELNQRNEPLVLIGLEDNLSFYKKINNYNRVVDRALTGNPDELSGMQLKDEGWKEIKTYFLKDMYSSLEQFSEKDNQKVSNNLAKIVESTVMGKSKTIFISQGESRWGRYDDSTHEVHFTDSPNKDDVDLLNWLASKGRETGSKVYILPKDEMPIKATVAAEFRF
ncbi:MAG: hypothetical protein WEA58_09080 [Balneolaceae bacterium]